MADGNNDEGDDKSTTGLQRSFDLSMNTKDPLLKHAYLDQLAKEFHDDGFVALSNVFETNVLAEWQIFGEKYFPLCFDILHQMGHIRAPNHQIVSEETGSRDYTLGLGAKHGFREIVMRSPGRYELSLQNLDSNRLKKFTSESPIQVPDTSLIFSFLEPLLPKLLGSKDSIKLCHLSLLVATPGSVDQGWHADGGHVSIQEHLPCHCFNAFFPLQDIPLPMGPTEFRPGSHVLTRNLGPMMLAARCRKTLRAPEWSPLTMGDLVLFDYRVLHRGRANTTDKNRFVLVCTFCHSWFEDVLNFPKRSMMDPAETEREWREQFSYS